MLEDERFARDLLLLPLACDFSRLADVEVIAIDVPIGFGPRAADGAARKFLSGSASTVFTTPPRDVLELTFRPGLGVTKQAHSLGPRILHVTQAALADSRLHEVHPEVSFRAMADSQNPLHRKKSAAGALERIELLRRHGIELSDLHETAGVPLDDVLDAAAAAWSAARIARGEAKTLPDPPDHRDGLNIAIWY